MLYELIQGEHPYADKHRVVAISLALCAPEPVPAITTTRAPESARRLVARCLEKDPALRPASQELVEELRGMLHQDAPSTRADTNPFRGLLAFTEATVGPMEMHCRLFSCRREMGPARGRRSDASLALAKGKSRR